MSESPYASVTQRILDALERGTPPWRRPWQDLAGIPSNGRTGRPYRGVNLVLLSVAPFVDHRWLTFRQALELGGNVRKGERSTEVVFWKTLESQVEKEGGEKTTQCFPLLRFYRVFNVQQCEGLSLPDLEETLGARRHERIPRAESVVRHMPDPPAVRQGETSAWYVPADDMVGVPPIAAFRRRDAFYATLFHELAHATGHGRRLNRPGVAGNAAFGSEPYSREELVAELASAFVCASIGLDNSLVEDAAAYVGGWLRALRTDPKALVVASGQAQRAAEWIFGRTLSLAE